MVAGSATARRGQFDYGTFDGDKFLRELKQNVARVQSAENRESRNEAVEQLLSQIRAAKDVSAKFGSYNKRKFRKMVHDISGIHLQAPNDVEFIAHIELADRLPRYTRKRSHGEPEMRLIQLAIKTEGEQNSIVAIAERDSEHYVIFGTIGGTFETNNAAHINDARQQFSEIARKSGYREVSPAAYHTLR